MDDVRTMRLTETPDHISFPQNHLKAQYSLWMVTRSKSNGTPECECSVALYKSVLNKFTKLPMVILDLRYTFRLCGKFCGL